MPNQFKDALGNVHTLRVTCLTQFRVERDLNLSFANLPDRLKAEKRTTDFLMLAYHALDGEKISFEDFAAGIQHVDQQMAMAEAAGAALADFFQSEKLAKPMPAAAASPGPGAPSTK
jgi:hypothetical protein